MKAKATCTAALLLGLLHAPALAADGPHLTEAATHFTGAEPYETQEVERVQRTVQDVLEGDPESVTPAGSRLAPPTRALLKLEAAEGTIAPARYRIRYGLVEVPNPPNAEPLTVSLVQIDRFNLGPARRAERRREHGAGNVRAESFAGDDHVSWRFATRPVMGTTAMTAAAARAEIPHAFAETMDCLGAPCTAAATTEATGLNWQAAEAPGLDFESDYAIERDGVPSPAAVLDLLLAESNAARRNETIVWRGFEPREGVAEGSPFVDIVIETGLGQDGHIAGLLRDDHLMDHTTRTRWTRLRAAATAPGRAPAMDLARARVPRPRPQLH